MFVLLEAVMRQHARAVRLPWRIHSGIHDRILCLSVGLVLGLPLSLFRVPLQRFLILSPGVVQARLRVWLNLPFAGVASKLRPPEGSFQASG